MTTATKLTAAQTRALTGLRQHCARYRTATVCPDPRIRDATLRALERAGHLTLSLTYRSQRLYGTTGRHSVAVVDREITLTEA